MERITLEPVDGVDVTTVVDNSSDVLMPDEGLVRRWGPAGTAEEIPVIPTELAEGGKTVDFLRAEHGFSALIDVQVGGRRRRVLFDAGITPDGLIGNLDRLAISPDTFEAVVLSHGHFDHVMGLDGLARRLGPRNMPLLLHPDFWTRRRIVTPGGGAWELPMPSRSGIQGAGFAVIEDRQPSFLLDGVLLITGEVDRTTEFETGFPAHQAWRDGEWVPDPLIHDDQAVVLHVRDKGLVVLTGCWCGHSGIVNIVRRWPRRTPACWSRPTAPAGKPSMPSPPDSPAPSGPTRSAAASNSESFTWSVRPLWPPAQARRAVWPTWIRPIRVGWG
jgi:7,8-dihydropterin-6-yl-methyl-4-(beta-D-ribofuranosyl)aminobenzene 5'-phosphate synthase